MLGLESDFPNCIYPAKNGIEALALWKMKGPFDVVISDYDMPLMNGAELYLKVHQLDPRCPFVLLSSHHASELKELKKFQIENSKNRSLLKPEQLTRLTVVLKEIVGDKKHSDESHFVLGHRPVALRALRHLNQIPVDLYIKLSDKKMVRVIAANELYSSELTEHYLQKVDYLFCLENDFQNLMNSVFAHIKSLLESKKLSKREESDFQIQAVRTVHQLLEMGGISKEIIELADKTMTTVYSKVVKNKQVRTLLRRVLLNHESYLYTHSLSIPYIAIAICYYMDWTSSGTLETISTTALLHDSTLEPSAFERFFGIEFDPAKEGEMRTNMALRRYYDHPQASASLIGDELNLNWFSWVVIFKE